jgi:hypothetical protein
MVANLSCADILGALVEFPMLYIYDERSGSRTLWQVPGTGVPRDCEHVNVDVILGLSCRSFADSKQEGGAQCLTTKVFPISEVCLSPTRTGNAFPDRKKKSVTFVH